MSALRLLLLSSVLFGTIAWSVTSVSEAAQFRRITPIAKPLPPPEGFARVGRLAPLPRAVVEQAIRDFFTQWNSAGLLEFLSDRFHDRQRLVDQIALSAPRSARIRLLSLQGVSTLGQFERPDDDGGRVLLSRVSAIARTQLEFTSPVTGLNRLEGTHEYNFTITSRAPGP